MILKDADDRSADIAELKRLKDTSPPAFQAAIQRQIDNLYSGIEGERDAAHFLKREFGRSENMAILHDLRLGVDGDFAQIDHLVIHRVQRAAWVLETKNYSGRLSCDEHGDWTVWRSNKPTSIASPVNQARRQCKLLRLWLDENGYATFGKIHPVVLISPTSSVNRAKLPPGSHVVKSDNFATWWEGQTDAIGLGTAIGMVGRHMLTGMSPGDLVALGEELARAHVPFRCDWRAKLRLPNPAPKSQRLEGEPVTPAKAACGDLPLTIATALGAITISRIPDGRYALRNEQNDALIEHVRKACKGKARWNPRYRNWLFDSAELDEILVALGPASEEQSASQG